IKTVRRSVAAHQSQGHNQHGGEPHPLRSGKESAAGCMESGLQRLMLSDRNEPTSTRAQKQGMIAASGTPADTRQSAGSTVPCRPNQGKSRSRSQGTGTGYPADSK
ncbi:MAG: hypothetical protein ACPIOQ_81495, partial [Promethearchaeia archaeon]